MDEENVTLNYVLQPRVPNDKAGLNSTHYILCHIKATLAYRLCWASLEQLWLISGPAAELSAAKLKCLATLFPINNKALAYLQLDLKEL